MFRAETAETPEEADRLVHRPSSARATPELLPRDVVARAITPRSRPVGFAARWGFSGHRLPADAEYIRRRLPSMYHQFKQLADVDITQDPWRSAPPATTRWVGAGRRGYRPGDGSRSVRRR